MQKAESARKMLLIWFVGEIAVGDLGALLSVERESKQMRTTMLL